MKRLHYIILNVYLFIESLLWTAIDLTRAARVKHAAKMHKKYIPQQPPDGSVEVTNNSQE